MCACAQAPACWTQSWWGGHAIQDWTQHLVHSLCPNPTSRCCNDRQAQQSTLQEAALPRCLHLPLLAQAAWNLQTSCSQVQTVHDTSTPARVMHVLQRKRAPHQPLSCGFVLLGGVFLDGWLEEWLRLV